MIIPHDTLLLADLVALKPMSYFVRLGLACVAFSAAMNPERVIGRVLGFVWLLVAGILFVWVGIGSRTVVDFVLGLAALVAAGYSWWYTRA